MFFVHVYSNYNQSENAEMIFALEKSDPSIFCIFSFLIFVSPFIWEALNMQAKQALKTDS